MHNFAQTNIQLYNQMRLEGYSNEDLTCVINAYNLAMQLFVSCFRSSGKSFIAHLVGTASILASLHAPTEVVAAGLVHAAYEYGDFGDGKKRGISHSRRETVKHFVGQEIEEYIAKYFGLSWNQNTILYTYNHFDNLTQFERNVLLMRLANELEEYLDYGLIYCASVKQDFYSHHSQDMIIEMANKLGFHALANDLEKRIQENYAANIPIALCNPQKQKQSFTVVAKSYNRKLLVRLSHYLVHTPINFAHGMIRGLKLLTNEDETVITKIFNFIPKK
jgi:(p)ppGpp synthase/HD superfamily hydrolase